MLSRGFQILWLFLLVCLAASGVCFWLWHPWWILVLGIAPGLGFVFVFSSQFMLLYLSAGRLKPVAAVPGVGAPTWVQVLRAWWGEGVAVLKACWWLPFRARAWPDFLPDRPTGRRGVVLIHGFVCNRALWMPWFPLLRARGHAYVAVTMEPVFGSIDDYVPLVEEAVQRVTRATGMPPILVCHSMGGLAARAWLRVGSSNLRVRRVEHVITIGTPHAGTMAAALNPFRFARNALQMRPQSNWLKRLQQDEARQASGSRTGGVYSRFTCYHGHCDTIVFPLGTAVLPGADNRHVPATAHIAMMLHPRVVKECMARLAA